jgi:hypothetical protein
MDDKHLRDCRVSLCRVCRPVHNSTCRSQNQNKKPERTKPIDVKSEWQMSSISGPAKEMSRTGRDAGNHHAVERDIEHLLKIATRPGRHITVHVRESGGSQSTPENSVENDETPRANMDINMDIPPTALSMGWSMIPRHCTTNSLSFCKE